MEVYASSIAYVCTCQFELSKAKNILMALRAEKKNEKIKLCTYALYAISAAHIYICILTLMRALQEIQPIIS